MTTSKLTWTNRACCDCENLTCGLCAMRTDGVRNRAVTLGIVVGFCSDGSGSAELVPVCAQCARQDNVVACRATIGC